MFTNFSHRLPFFSLTLLQTKNVDNNIITCIILIGKSSVKALTMTTGKDRYIKAIETIDYSDLFILTTLLYAHIELPISILSLVY